MKTPIPVLAALLLLFASSAAADGVIYPTGQWPTDVGNVQAAVDQGGRVLLKATNTLGVPTAFNFGPGTSAPAGVAFGRFGADATVVGEGVPAGMTTVLGGYVPFRHQAPARVQLGIYGIHFEGPLEQAIYLDSFVRAHVVDNVITHVRPRNVGGLDIGKGIFTWGANPLGHPHGPLEIRDNRIEDVGGSLSYGIEVLLPSTASTIEGNLIQSVNSNGIIVLYAGALTTVRANDVRPGFIQVPGALHSSANGIWIEGDLGGSVHVIANIVSCVDPVSNGILVIGSPGLPVRNALVTGNVVTMENSQFQGIALFDQVSDTVVSGNRVMGTALNALAVTFTSSPAATARGNVLMDNDLTQFQSGGGDVLVDANAVGTLVLRQSGIVLDWGTRTRIVP